MHTRDYRRLAHFVHIAEAGSIRAAARRLGLSPAVVSTALADLEAALGTTLVRRGRRPLAITEAGRRLHEAAASMVEAGTRAMALAAARPRAAGPLAITLPTELSVAWLPNVLTAFERRHPDVHTVIHALDSAVDLARSDYDLALRAFYTLAPERPADVIAFLPLVLVAAPQLCRGRLPLAALLAELPFIGFTARTDDATLAATDARGRTVHLPTRCRCYVNNGFVAKEMAKAGFGAALVIEVAVAEDLRAGLLTRVDRAHRFGAVAVRVLLRDKLPTPAARAFAEFLRSRPRRAGLARISQTV